MLADKHITGEGKGYCDITFGKESKKSLIINIQYNIFAPIIYMLLIATVLLILSILVDTFISKISFPMQPGPEIGSISDA